MTLFLEILRTKEKKFVSILRKISEHQSVLYSEELKIISDAKSEGGWRQTTNTGPEHRQSRNTDDNKPQRFIAVVQNPLRCLFMNAFSAFSVSHVQFRVKSENKGTEISEGSSSRCHTAAGSFSKPPSTAITIKPSTAQDPTVGPREPWCVSRVSSPKRGAVTVAPIHRQKAVGRKTKTHQAAAAQLHLLYLWIHLPQSHNHHLTHLTDEATQAWRRNAVPRHTGDPDHDRQTVLTMTEHEDLTSVNQTVGEQTVNFGIVHGAPTRIVTVCLLKYHVHMCETDL